MKQFNLNKSYRKTFTLTPDVLTKMIEVLVNGLRIPPGDIALKFTVFRVDGTNYSCDRLEHVLADDNISGQKIEILTVEISDTHASEEHSLFGYVRFDSTPTADNHLTISLSDSRKTPVDDSLASNILPFVERCLSGAERKLGVPKWIHGFLLPVFFLILAYYAAKSYVPTFNRQIAEMPFSIFTLQFTICIFVIVLTFALSENLKLPPTWNKYFGRQSVFAWGDEAVAYRRREAIRDKLFWVLVVGLVVSFIAGFLGAWLFRLITG